MPQFRVKRGTHAIGSIFAMEKGDPGDDVKQEYQDTRVSEIHGGEPIHDHDGLVLRPRVPVWRVSISLLLLFLNYFLAQYDKFILSYFQKSILADLSLSSANYGILSGYATGIVYALLAIPTAYVADYTRARVWVLTVAAVWWSLCVIFQGLSNDFWQILCARIGMGIGQAPVEVISVSLISDLMGKEYVFFGEGMPDGACRRFFVCTKSSAEMLKVFCMLAFMLVRLSVLR